MAEETYFDVRKSVVRRNVEATSVYFLFGIGCTLIGITLIPDSFRWSFSIDAIETWGGWGFLGVILIGTGFFNLVKTVIFAIRSRGTSGEWHFRLTEQSLLWDVPVHAFGPETGFETPKANIKAVECRTIVKDEAPNIQEFWIHLRDREPLQLQDYTGISISSLVSKIHEAGVPYNETVVDG